MSDQNDYPGYTPSWQGGGSSPYGGEGQNAGNAVRPPAEIPAAPGQQPQGPAQPIRWKETQYTTPPAPQGQPFAPPYPQQPYDQNGYALNAALAQASANHQMWMDAYLRQMADSLLEGVTQALKKSAAEIIQKVEENQAALENQLRSIQEAAVTAPDESDAQKQLLSIATEMKERNMDVLRDFKLFQSTTAKTQQAELDKYRDLHAGTVKTQILTEVAKAYSAAKKVLDNEEGDIRRRLTNLLLSPLEELLVEENGVTIHQTPEKADRSFHTCTTRQKIHTADQSLHGKVAKSVSPSFSLGSVVLIREVVDTYVYDPKLAEKESPAPQPEPAEEAAAPAPEAEPIQEPAAPPKEPAPVPLEDQAPPAGDDNEQAK